MVGKWAAVAAMRRMRLWIDITSAVQRGTETCEAC